MPTPLRTAGLQLRTARRLLRGRSLSPGAFIEPLDDRLVFVVGSPRSGTTFLAGAIGSGPGFLDLGELAPLKAEIPALCRMAPAEAAMRIRRTLATSRRLGLVGSLRGVEQTPETAYVLAAARLAFPAAVVVHIVRDGRDVVCSLLERGWLSAGRGGGDDAGAAYGAHPRFWVESGREPEFRQVSDARRAAWAWRRYVGAVLTAGVDVHEVRYERLARDPESVARALAQTLDADGSTLAAALSRVHAESVGRYRRDLTADELADVEAEAGPLLQKLGYLQ